MVSLWGSKKEDDPERRSSHNGDGESSRSDERPRHSTSSEADERTRLIPPSEPHEGYLSPDDPAVRESSY